MVEDFSMALARDRGGFYAIVKDQFFSHGY